MTVLSVLFLTRAVVDLRRTYSLRPVMGPVEVVWVPRVGILSTEYHAVYEAAEEREETEYEENYPQYPYKQRLEELQHDHEPKGDQYET